MRTAAFEKDMRDVSIRSDGMLEVDMRKKEMRKGEKR